MHEAECHEDSSFITLTYGDAVPEGGSLSVSVAQLFMKRFRERLRDRKNPKRIRFFLCGEYGEKFGRPHYHALIFGYDFPDKTLLMESDGIALFKSEELEDIWGFGYCSIGQVTFDSACYVAKYALKKVKGPSAPAHYKGLFPEFLLMSRRPGIGRAWIEKFSSDVYPSDEVIVNGFPGKPPRYYDQVVESLNPGLLEAVKVKREKEAGLLEDEVKLRSGASFKVARSRNLRRLRTARIVKEAKMALKSRKLES